MLQVHLCLIYRSCHTVESVDIEVRRGGSVTARSRRVMDPTTLSGKEQVQDRCTRMSSSRFLLYSVLCMPTSEIGGGGGGGMDRPAACKTHELSQASCATWRPGMIVPGSREGELLSAILRIGQLRTATLED